MSNTQTEQFLDVIPIEDRDLTDLQHIQSNVYETPDHNYLRLQYYAYDLNDESEDIKADYLRKLANEFFPAFSDLANYIDIPKFSVHLIRSSNERGPFLALGILAAKVDGISIQNLNMKTQLDYEASMAIFNFCSNLKNYYVDVLEGKIESLIRDIDLNDCILVNNNHLVMVDLDPMVLRRKSNIFYKLLGLRFEQLSEDLLKYRDVVSPEINGFDDLIAEIGDILTKVPKDPKQKPSFLAA